MSKAEVLKAGRSGGRQLATVWLSGYLTRPTRNDRSWTATVADLTDPDLLQDLQRQGPDLVGLADFERWKVTAVTPINRVVDRTATTPTRQILNYAATISDGERQTQKPFQLYAYLGPDQRWRVTNLYQPYSSEG